jgi:hypothetical protein
MAQCVFTLCRAFHQQPLLDAVPVPCKPTCNFRYQITDATDVQGIHISIRSACLAVTSGSVGEAQRNQRLQTRRWSPRQAANVANVARVKPGSFLPGLNPPNGFTSQPPARPPKTPMPLPMPQAGDTIKDLVGHPHGALSAQPRPRRHRRPHRNLGRPLVADPLRQLLLPAPNCWLWLRYRNPRRRGRLV